MIGQGELRTPHAAREQEQKQYVPPPGDIIILLIIWNPQATYITWNFIKFGDKGVFDPIYKNFRS